MKKMASDAQIKRLQDRFDEEVTLFGRAIPRANPKGGVSVVFKRHNKMTKAEQKAFENAVEQVMWEEGFTFSH
jgi:hypothetical protein